MSATSDSSLVDLKNADLTWRQWEGANLYGADLRVANLSNSNLSNADLRYANLSGAHLSDTKFQGARYTTKAMQVKDVEGKLVSIKPTQWPEEFDPKAKGAICVDCQIHTIRVSK
jgi:hypothetical protein